MSGILQLGYDYSNNRTAAISVDSNGKLDVDVELNTSGLATSANQTNGTQLVKAMGSEDGTTGGTQKQIHLDGSGNVQTNVVNTVNIAPANSVNSHITDDPANSVAVGLKGRTTIGTATSEQFLLCDAAGHLQVDVVSGGGGGDASAANQTTMITKLTAIDTSTSSIQSNVATSSNQTTAIGHLSEIEGAVETLETCVSSSRLDVNQKQLNADTSINSVVSSSTNNTSSIIDLNGYTKILCIGKTDTSSASFNLEFSDASDFAGGTDVIYNNDGSGGTAPITFSSASSSDGALLYFEGVAHATIPQRYMRIRVFNTSGSNRDFSFFYKLLN